MSDPYRRNAKDLITDPAWCSTCRLERKRGILEPCECGDYRPPIAPHTYKCEGFVPHPKAPKLCVRCGAGSHARNEHLKECFFHVTCGNWVDDPVSDDLCATCKYHRQVREQRMDELRAYEAVQKARSAFKLVIVGLSLIIIGTVLRLIAVFL